MVIALLLRRRSHPIHRLGDDQVHRHVVAPSLLVGLDARELEQVVDGAADAEGLGQHPLGQALGDGRVVLGEQRLGEQGQRARPAS